MMKTRTIILTIVLCAFIVVSCTNKQKQQNAIIGSADSTTEIVIAEKNSKQDRDTISYELQDCLLWYTKQLPEKYRDQKACMWTEYENYRKNVQIINVFVANPTDAWWLFGRSWNLEVWNGEKWISPKSKRDLSWFDDGFAIEKAPLLYCFRFPVGRYFYLSEGKYRIKKGFSMNKGKDCYTDFVAEFYISNF